MFLPNQKVNKIHNKQQNNKQTNGEQIAIQLVSFYDGEIRYGDTSQSL